MCVCEPQAVGTAATSCGAVGSLTSKIRSPSNPGTRKSPGVPRIGCVPAAKPVSTAVAHSGVVTGSSMDWIRSRRLFAL